MKRFVLLATLAIFSLTTGFAQITVRDGDLQGGQTYNWTKNNTYILDGEVFLEAGGVLNIQEGTVIKAMQTPSPQAPGNPLTSALIIARDAEINATGTATEPIIFTSDQDDVNDPSDLGANDRGLWGGLILLGNAPIAANTQTRIIEGFPSSETRATYGGTNAADNSGTLKYVSIRHGGAEYKQNEEINGLTLGAVGSQTVIEHIEVFANLDDGIEWFGGTVDVKWASVAYCGDECFDYDQGWRGKGQFWFGLVGFDDGDQSGEHDGVAGSSNLIAFPWIYNATYIGAGDTAQSVKCPRVLHFKDRAGGIYGNSIFAYFPKKGLEVQDDSVGQGDDSYAIMLRDSLKLMNNIWYSTNWSNLDDLLIIPPNDDHPNATELKDHLTNNGNTLEDPQFNGISWGTRVASLIFGDGLLDPRPQAGGPAETNVATVPSDPFFTNASYKGAFEPNGNLWLQGWTALDALGFLQNVGIEDLIASDINLQVYPNPTTGNARVSFTLETSEQVNITLTDINGRVVEHLNSGKVPAGTQQYELQTGRLAKGVYFLNINQGKNGITKRVVVQ